jgi:hypothetical protein
MNLSGKVLLNRKMLDHFCSLFCLRDAEAKSLKLCNFQFDVLAMSIYANLRFRKI